MILKVESKLQDLHDVQFTAVLSQKNLQQPTIEDPVSFGLRTNSASLLHTNVKDIDNL